MTRRVTRACLLAVCCAAALRGAAGEMPAVPAFRYGIIADFVGFANIVPADITGDGRPEIISCSNGAPFAMEYRSGAYAQRWFGPAVDCKAVAAGDADGDGATDVIVAGSTGLYIFDPRGSGAPRASVAIPTVANDVAFGNVDFDAAPEIVVVSNFKTYVYDAATLQLQWTVSHGGNHGVIADVDGDARNEIILGDGSILDGGHQVLKWGYLGGFQYLTAGNVDADAKAEIVFTPNGYATSVTVLNGDTMTTSTVTGFPTIQELAVGDADGDGVNEIIAGNDQWGSITARHADSTAAWSIDHPDSGCMAIAVADVDGDGVREVIWGAGWSSSGQDALYVGNAQTHTVEWVSVDLDGPFSVAAGDLDGDGRTELVVVAASSESGYAGSIVKIFDAATGVEQREITMGYSYASRVAIAQLDGDPALEIAVYTQSVIRVFDGVTGAIEWTSPGSLLGMVIANVDADPTSEIITSYDGKLVVIHGLTNIIQSSRVFSGQPLAAGDVTGDGVPEVIAATTTTLYVFSSTLANQTEVPLGNAVAATTTTQNGGRIAVLADYGRQLLLLDKTLTQQWTCPSPDNIAYTAVAFGTVAGQLRLLSGDQTGVIRAMPLGGNTCPSSDTRSLGSRVNDLSVADVNGDGRSELIAGSFNAAEISLIGLPTEMRGDVNGDAVIAENDIDQLVDYLFSTGTGLSPTGDANADERLSGEDAFALIHYQFSGGSLPQ
jgi:hypothetical protein